MNSSVRDPIGRRSDDRTETPLSASPFTAQDASLFLVLVIATDGLVLPGLFAPGQVSAPLLMTVFHLAMFPHVGATLYLGRFGALRTATWLPLIAISAASELFTFVPWSWHWPSVSPHLWPALALSVLGLDVIVMHREEWRARPAWRMVVFLVTVVAVTVTLDFLATSTFSPPFPPASQDLASATQPPWHTLPLFAILRTTPDKMLGLMVTCAAALAPMIWPWSRTDLLRIGGTRWAWRLVCTTFCATWIGLGWLGARPAEGLALHVARVLAALYFAYFLLSPLAGRWRGGMEADRTLKIFD